MVVAGKAGVDQGLPAAKSHSEAHSSTLTDCTTQGPGGKAAGSVGWRLETLFPGKIISGMPDCVSPETQHCPLLVEGCHCLLSHLPLPSAQVSPELTSSHPALGCRVPLSRVQPPSPSLMHQTKIWRHNPSQGHHLSL